MEMHVQRRGEQTWRRNTKSKTMVIACFRQRFCLSSLHVVGFFCSLQFPCFFVRSFLVLCFLVFFMSILYILLFVSLSLYWFLSLWLSVFVALVLLWVLTAFSFSSTLFSPILSLSPPPPPFFFFLPPSVRSLLSLFQPENACVFLDNKDIKDHYCKSNGNGRRWQGRTFFLWFYI